MSDQQPPAWAMKAANTVIEKFGGFTGVPERDSIRLASIIAAACPAGKLAEALEGIFKRCGRCRPAGECNDCGVARAVLEEWEWSQ